jgi:hypothetical protein
MATPGKLLGPIVKMDGKEQRRLAPNPAMGPTDLVKLV